MFYSVVGGASVTEIYSSILDDTRRQLLRTANIISTAMIDCIIIFNRTSNTRPTVWLKTIRVNYRGIQTRIVLQNIERKYYTILYTRRKSILASVTMDFDSEYEILKTQQYSLFHHYNMILWSRVFKNKYWQ